jgi:uncharacterized protein YjiS (DUF1127 family)
MEDTMPSFASILTLPAFRSLSVTLPLGEWIRVARERRMLAGLNERQLRDLGIDAGAAADEAARPFWDLPRRR